MKNEMNILFIGLGNMGMPMAINILNSGMRVTAYDNDSEKLAYFKKNGGEIAKSIKEACAVSDIVITILPNDEIVSNVMLSDDGIIKNSKENTLIIEMSTISPTLSTELAKKAADLNINFIDAPVGRTPQDAWNKTLLVMVGGAESLVKRAQPIFESFADLVLHLGPQGSGIRMKIINNFMSMSLMALTAETLAFAQKSGINLKTATLVLQSTTAGKGQININYPKKILNNDISPDFPVKLGIKDLNLALSLAEDEEVSLSIGQSCQDLFEEALEIGLSNYDCTSLLIAMQNRFNIDSQFIRKESNNEWVPIKDN